MIPLEDGSLDIPQPLLHSLSAPFMGSWQWMPSLTILHTHNPAHATRTWQPTVNLIGSSPSCVTAVAVEILLWWAGEEGGR